MTTEQIILLAMEAGAKVRIYSKSPGLDHYEFETQDLVRFVEYLLAQKEES